MRKFPSYGLTTDWWDGHVAREVGTGYGRLLQSYDRQMLHHRHHVYDLDLWSFTIASCAASS